MQSITHEIWNLPGPKRFLGELETLIAGGSSLFLHCPKNLPDGWIHPLGLGLKTIGKTLVTLPESSHPSEALKPFFPGIPPEDPASLYESESFSCQVFVVRLSPGLDCNPWCRFLEGFAAYTREIQEYRRSSFLVVPGDKQQMDARRDQLLAFRDFDGVFDEIDLLVCAAMNLPTDGSDLPLVSLHRQLCVELAKGDVSALMDFATIPLGRLLRSCKDEFSKQALWRAELKVLFPWLEFQRQSILNVYGQKIDLPHVRLDRTEIAELNGLELGDLKVVFSHGDFPRPLKTFIRTLWMIRNDLAHMRPTNPDYLSPAGLSYKEP